MNYQQMSLNTGDELATLQDHLRTRSVAVYATTLSKVVVDFDNSTGEFGAHLGYPGFPGGPTGVPVVPPTGLDARFYKWGFQYLLYRCDLPDEFFSTRSPEDLTVEHIRRVTIKPGADKTWVNFHLEDGAVIGAMSSRHAYTPHGRFVDQIAAVPNTEVGRWKYDPAVLQVWSRANNLNNQSRLDLQNGDEILLEMEFANSETGHHALDLRGVVTLYTGGVAVGSAVLPARYGSYHARHQGAATNLTAEFDKVWGTLTSGFRRVAKRVATMVTVSVTTIEADGIIDQIVEELKLPERVHRQILALAGGSIYNIWSAVLKVADLPANASVADKMRVAAGNWVIDTSRGNPLLAVSWV